MKCQCANCDRVWEESDLKEIKDYSQRVKPGEIVPAGECSKCGALCYPIEEGS